MTATLPPQGTVSVWGMAAGQTQTEEFVHLKKPLIHVPLGHEALELPLLFLFQWLLVLSWMSRERLLCFNRENQTPLPRATVREILMEPEFTQSCTLCKLLCINTSVATLVMAPFLTEAYLMVLKQNAQGRKE